MKRPSPAIPWLLAAFWLAVAVVVAAPALAMWRGWLGFAPPSTPLALGAAAAVAVGAAALAVALFARRAWARPAAALYHVALAAWLAAVLFLFWPYSGLVARLPAVLTANSWSGVIVLAGAATGLFSLIAAAWLLQRTAWQAFGSAPNTRRGAFCPTCGATVASGDGPAESRCPFCKVVDVTYFLQPLLPGARPIPLRFGLGYERLHVGRGADPREGRLGKHEQRAFGNVSAQHAWLELDPATGEVYLGPDKPTSEVRLNGAGVEQRSAALVAGDLIELGKVPFLFVPAGYPFRVAHWYPVEDPEQKTLMIFDTKEPEWLIGRENCLVMIPPQRKDISRQHAAIAYSEAGHSFWVLNVSENNQVTVNGHDLRPGNQEQLSASQPSTIQLATYDYIFEPMTLASADPGARPA